MMRSKSDGSGIKATLEGQTSWRSKVCGSAARASGDGGPAAVSRSPITIREAEVMNLIDEGKTNGEIAKQLSISARTVEHHRASLMRKLKCRNKAELIRYALEQRERLFPVN